MCCVVLLCVDFLCCAVLLCAVLYCSHVGMMECNHCAIMRPTSAMHCYECGVCVDHVSSHTIPCHTISTRSILYATTDLLLFCMKPDIYREMFYVLCVRIPYYSAVTYVAAIYVAVTYVAA